jgi:hypothetical protein
MTIPLTSYFLCLHCATAIRVPYGYRRVVGAIGAILGLILPLAVTRDTKILLFVWLPSMVTSAMLVSLMAKLLVPPPLEHYRNEDLSIRPS